MRNPKPQRISDKLSKDMETLAIERIKRGLAKPKRNEVSMREMTDLLTRTQGYQMSLEELKIKPKRRTA